MATVRRSTRGFLKPLALLGVLAAFIAFAPAAASPGSTELVSVDSGGNQGDNQSRDPAISADGRFVSFASDATNLVVGDTNGVRDAFVRDRQTGATERVSVDSAGGQANNASLRPVISGDGRFVAFSSLASNLVAGDTNGTFDAFVHDRQTGTTERVSVDSVGAEGNASSFARDINSDGRFVAFFSNAGNLVAGDTNAAADVFVRDRQLGTTERVSVDSAGAEANASSGPLPTISADGRFVAFTSNATNLVVGDTNGVDDVFVRDRMLGVTERVSVDSGGVQGNARSVDPAVSGDGRFVSFESPATNLVAGDTNGFEDIFVHDRQTGATTRVSVDSLGVQGDFPSFFSDVSGDGRFVAFASEATNLVVGDTNGTGDIFIHDRQTGTTERVSVDSSGGQSNADSGGEGLSISTDGRFVAFTSEATNLVVGDTNGTGDIFVHDRGPLDSTPPVILSSRIPAPNAAGWNNTDVTVSWTVSDPESGIASSTGCDTVTLTAETVGTTLTCSATNGGGLSSSAAVTVRIDKTPPTISIPTPEPFAVLPVGSALDFTAADALSGIDSVSAQLCDGASCVNVGSGFVPTAGVYTLTVEAVDVAGNISTESRFFVIFDPDAGFATGGGWFIPGGPTSDAGDTLPGLDNTSPAEFGFVVKYKPGASTPNGQLEFQYRQGSFNLHSGGIEWLVIVNNNFASFRGTATIQGMNGLFPFRVDARDSDFGGPGQPDRFQIKIWAEGANPDLDNPIHKASGDLQGGSIVIHTK